eukprot:PhF_6_TR16611/c0_g1_i1/m.25299
MKYSFSCFILTTVLCYVYAKEGDVEPVRDTFYLSPDDVVKRFQHAGYTIVPAPDSIPGHPELFYAGAPYSVSILKDETVIKASHPTVSVVVNKIGMSLTYLFNGYLTFLSDDKLTFCNNWNYRSRMATCFVDEKGRLTLNLETPFVKDHHVNSLVVDESIKYFERAVGVFTKRVLEQPHPERRSEEKKSSEL